MLKKLLADLFDPFPPSTNERMRRVLLTGEPLPPPHQTQPQPLTGIERHEREKMTFRLNLGKLTKGETYRCQ